MTKATEPTPLKRVVIKEELVKLTKHHIPALILNQFLYWTQRAKDYDAMLVEELQRNPDITSEPTHGWIYKKSEQLAAELMVDYGVPTIRKYITQCVNAKWLFERHNPKHAYDRTLQYRANIRQIQADLQELGFALEGYPLLSNNEIPTSNNENGNSINVIPTAKNHRAIPEITNIKYTAEKNGHTRPSKPKPQTTAEREAAFAKPDRWDQVES